MHLSVIVVYRLHPHSGGWKKEKNDALCNLKGDQFIKCIENNSYYNYGHDIDQSNFVSTKYFYFDRILIMGQNLEVKSGSITHRFTASLRIPVDDTLNYFIYILDSKIHFPTYDPTLINGIIIERLAKPFSNMIAIKVEKFIFMFINMYSYIHKVKFDERYTHTTRHTKIFYLACISGNKTREIEPT